MNIDIKIKRTLLNEAKKAQEKAYTPYSNFPVGAALLTKGGKIYTGCNIENASFGATNCAERTAIFKGVSEGEREFTALAITSNHPSFTFPCGICRQVIHEFSKDILVIFEDNEGEILTLSIQDLLTYPFGQDDLTQTKEEN